MELASKSSLLISRRALFAAAAKLGLVYGTGLSTALANDPRAPSKVLRRTIPSSGEEIVALGVGTKASLFSVTDPKQVAERHEILKALVELGGSVVDTADQYGQSQDVIGGFVAELGNRRRLFIATKIYAANDNLVAAKRQLENAFRALRTDMIDLLQVHSLEGVDVLMPVLEECKKDGRVRYVGVTADADSQHSEVVRLLRKYRLDFVQINYSIDLRNAAKRVLPAAVDRGTAVLANLTLRDRERASLFRKVEDQSLPIWAAELGAHTWAQFFLKYVLSNPAVTCAIPGTSKRAHLLENFKAVQGPLPDGAMRRRMEELWDSLW